MKKMKCFILLFILSFTFVTEVKAATITNTEYQDNKFSVSGRGNGEIQIVLFDKDNSPIYMTTTTCSYGKFNLTLPSIEGLGEGKYTVKVSDYDGQNVNSMEIKISSKEIYIKSSEHGMIVASKMKAFSGEKITLTITPEKGYKLKSIKGNYYIYSEDAIIIDNLDDIENDDITNSELTKKDLTFVDNSFVMPDDKSYAVVINAEFEKEINGNIISNVDINNPKTYDKILYYAVISIVGLIGLIITGLYLKKEIMNSN